MTGDVGSVVVAVAAAVVVEVYDLVVETVAVGIESVVGRIVVDAVGREIDCLDLRLQGSCCGLELMASCSMNPTRKTDPFLPPSLMTLSLCLCMFVLISEEEERQVMPPMDRRRNAMLSRWRSGVHRMVTKVHCKGDTCMLLALLFMLVKTTDHFRSKNKTYQSF